MAPLVARRQFARLAIANKRGIVFELNGFALSLAGSERVAQLAPKNSPDLTARRPETYRQAQLAGSVVC